MSNIPLRSRLASVILAAAALAACATGSAKATETATPALSIKAVAGPTIFAPAFKENAELTNDYTVTVTNTGSVPTSGPIAIGDELPSGLSATSIFGILDGEEGEVSAACDLASVTCTYSHVLAPDQRIVVVVAVHVPSGMSGKVTDSALVSGGGAPSAAANVVTPIGSEAESNAVPFGLASLTAETTGPNGLPDEQAGDHPYESTVTFSLNTVVPPAGERYKSPQIMKDVVVDLPPGFVGDPNAVEKCPQYEVLDETCPATAQIGWAKLLLFGRQESESINRESYPIYNVVPPKGYPAEFVIDIRTLSTLVPLYASVTPESNYGVRLITPDISEIGSPTDVAATFFGTPATNPSVHNAYRTHVLGGTPTAFLDDPVDCSTKAQQTTVYVDSWQNPASWLASGQPDLADPRWASKSTTIFPSLTGCELLQFNPSLTVTPDTSRADEPAGTTVTVHVPQAPQQFPATVTPEFRDTTVTLPSGLSLDPSAGDGLEGCGDAQIDLSTYGPGSCPAGSQIGTVKVATPLLSEPLEGQVFLGTPHCNPCTDADAADGNMYRIFLQFSGSGVVVKLEGRIFANPTTGQLTATFKELPQLPVSEVQLHFNGGLRAGLATPQACGTFTSTADITPYSTPITPDATPFSQFDVDWNGDGEACPGTWPFHPEFEAGTSNPNAGQLSPLTVTFNREDREQDLSQIKVTTPPGLLGSLSGIPLCGEPQADLGTCAAASQIGEMTVAAGAGSHPYYQKGQVYLTGPYDGAPFGLSIVVPTHAGPFNLGDVVVRARIDIDPSTAALTVTTDPLPQILDGIPLRLRKANVTINRPGFIFNPTDCAQLHITATVSGSQGAQAQESAPFAVAGCAGLSFGPKFSVAVSGRSSRADGTSLDAKLTFPAGPQSNIAHVKVELPKQLPSRLETLRKACTAAQFEANPAGCPAASVVGATEAVTPILPVPLRGPVYFVSHGGEAWPNLVAVLQGYGVRVDLVGNTFISSAGITSTTFTNVPDVPVSSFELFLPAGPYSALTGLGSLCKEKLSMPALFTAQDGAQLKQKTPVSVTGCAKAKKSKRSKRTGRRKSRKTRHASKARRARGARAGGHRHGRGGRS